MRGVWPGGMYSGVAAAELEFAMHILRSWALVIGLGPGLGSMPSLIRTAWMSLHSLENKRVTIVISARACLMN